MIQTGRIRRQMANAKTLVHSRESTARLADRRFGGMVIVDYLFDLFAASPFEWFSRLNVLSVLDQVKKDKDLFPTGRQNGAPSIPVRTHVPRERPTAKRWQHN